MQVVHGGNNDVIWLQRDFHIYMVNVFDTEKACQVTIHSSIMCNQVVNDRLRAYAIT